MKVRQFLTLLAAILITAVQTLILATDTAASTEAWLASAASPAQSTGHLSAA
jgi:hypothetical protein